MEIGSADRNVTLAGTLVTGVPWRASVAGAIVDVTGQLSVEVPEDAVRTLLMDQAMAGESLDPAEVAQQVAEVQAYVRSLSIVSPIEVASESGGWLVCSAVLGYTDPPEEAPSPPAS